MSIGMIQRETQCGYQEECWCSTINQVGFVSRDGRAVLHLAFTRVQPLFVVPPFCRKIRCGLGKLFGKAPFALRPRALHIRLLISPDNEGSFTC